jgi:hypothetical protein
MPIGRMREAAPVTFTFQVLIAGQRFRAQLSSASKSGIKSASSVCHALNLGEMTRQLIKK